MAEFVFPDEQDFRLFIKLIQTRRYNVSKYLPPVNDEWFRIVTECVSYVKETAHYEPCSLIECATRILYKIAKRHELGDGNKRSALMGTYLFCVLNDRTISDPGTVKALAKRIAKTKGRINEDVIRRRIATELESVVVNG